MHSSSKASVDGGYKQIKNAEQEAIIAEQAAKIAQLAAAAAQFRGNASNFLKSALQ